MNERLIGFRPRVWPRRRAPVVGIRQWHRIRENRGQQHNQVAALCQ